MKIQTMFEKEKTWLLFTVCGLYIFLSVFYLLLYKVGILELYASASLLIAIAVMFVICTFFAACAGGEIVHRFNSNKIIKNQSGWMLIDLMIAVVLLAVAGTAILCMYQQNTKANSLTTNHNYAIALAQQTLENIKKYDGTNEIKSLPDKVLKPDDVNKNNIKYSIKVQQEKVSETPSKMYPYSVTVTWSDSQGTHGSGTLPPVKIVAYYYSK